MSVVLPVFGVDGHRDAGPVGGEPAIHEGPELVGVDDVRAQFAEHAGKFSDSPRPQAGGFIDAVDGGPEVGRPAGERPGPFEADDGHPIPAGDPGPDEFEYDPFEPADVERKDGVGDMKHFDRSFTE
jgi:hypothetical protein